MFKVPVVETSSMKCGYKLGVKVGIVSKKYGNDFSDVPERSDILTTQFVQILNNSV